MSGRGITGRVGISAISSGDAIGPNPAFIGLVLQSRVCVADIDQNQLAADARVRWWGQMAQNEISSCNLVRASDLYFRLDVVCEPTGMTVTRGRRRRSWVCRAGSPGDQCPSNRLMSYITGQRTVGRWLAPSRRHNWGTLVGGGAAL